MATTRAESSHGVNSQLTAKGLRFGLVVADFNQEVTGQLKAGAIQALQDHGALEDDIICRHVPGSIELTLGAQLMAEHLNVDAVICLGSVIQGETRHFDYVCDSVTQGITQLNLRYQMPFIFGVLTTDNQQQALDRAGGKFGNKGQEAAETAIRMVALRQDLEQQ